MFDHVAELNKIDPDITQLAQNTKTVEDAFWRVERGFHEAMEIALPKRDLVDKLLRRDATKPYYAQLEDLLKKSREHKKEFMRLRNESRTVARTASEDLKELLGPLATCISNETITLPQKQAIITSFRMTVSKNQHRADEMAHGFENLRDAVGHFEKEVENLAAACKTDIGKLEPKIKELGSAVQALREHLSKVTWKKVGAGILISAGMNQLGHLAYVILGIVAPQFFLAVAAVTVVGVGSLVIPEALKYKEFLDAQWELKKAVAAKEGTEHVAKALAGLQGDLALVVLTLGVFARVWDVIDGALIAMEKQAGAVDERYILIPSLSNMELQKVFDICRPLAMALNNYAKIPYNYSGA